MAGDFVYIPPGMPHEAFNLSDNEPVVEVIARSAPDEREQTIPYDRAAALMAAQDGQAPKDS